MKAYALALFLASSGGAYAQDAFGLSLGEEVMDSRYVPADGEDRRVVREVPAPFSGFDGYIIRTGQGNVLCSVDAVMQPADLGQAELLLRRVRYGLADIYGEPDHQTLRPEQSATITDRWQWESSGRRFSLYRIVSEVGFDRRAQLKIEPLRKPVACGGSNSPFGWPSWWGGGSGERPSRATAVPVR